MRHPKPSLLLWLALLLPYFGAAQNSWNGKRCAVVLTYDDALNVHLDKVIPSLDSAGFRGTFYINGSAATLETRLNDWRMAASRGHELGNHSLTHPCDGSLPGRTWVSAESDLSRYSVARAVNEIRFTNTLLKAIDGKDERTFAYPCGDSLIGKVNYYDQVQHLFVAARGVTGAMLTATDANWESVNCYGMNGQSGDEMVALVKSAMAQGKLLVFLFHGVGGEHSLNVSIEAHYQLVSFLKQHEKEIWVAPLVEVAKAVRGKTEE